ncbi:hypothetical protein ACU045_11070 [Microbacterium sp. MAHUQ-60]|uniref:hypothetical protein n=1 Tax=unclassified Microbacterium TaxID=2609290 RepID=UPI00360B2AB5
MTQQVRTSRTPSASVWSRPVVAASVPIPSVAGYAPVRSVLTQVEHRCDDGTWLFLLEGATREAAVDVTIDSRRLSAVGLQRQDDDRWELNPEYSGADHADPHSLAELTDARARLTIHYADGESEVLALVNHRGGTSCSRRGAEHVQPRRHRAVAVIRPLDAVAG